MFDAAIDRSVKRDKAVLLGGLVLVAGIAWVYLVRMEAGASSSSCHGGAILPSAQPWSGQELAAAGTMWAVMMLGMMLPVVSPWLMVLAEASRDHDPKSAPLPSAGAFASGYGVMWLGYSAVAAVGQLQLQRSALLSQDWALKSPVFAAGLLAVAGLYQWSSLRDACMTHCRSPFGYFLSSWRPGPRGAFLMGVKHGTYCLGCCWALMALSFVFGVMNVLWMALLTAFLLVEKVASAGPWLSRLAGTLLLVGAVWMISKGA